MEFINIPPEELLPIIPDEMGRKLTGLILKAFTDKGLSYKVNTKYRIWCYIKKSKEALIINSCEMKNGEPYFNLQLRIKDMSTFEKLDEYSENVKNAILVHNTPCRAPDCENDRCEYIFHYHKKEYRLCHALCSNFRFSSINDDDIASIMNIIHREIAYDMPRRRRAK